jgi:hypothetical protein
MILLPEVPGLRLEHYLDSHLFVSEKTTRLHSHYRCTVADLTWGDRSVSLLLLFRCPRTSCPRRIFAEYLLSLVETHARKTRHLHEARPNWLLTD